MGAPYLSNNAAPLKRQAESNKGQPDKPSRARLDHVSAGRRSNRVWGIQVYKYTSTRACHCETKNAQINSGACVPPLVAPQGPQEIAGTCQPADTPDPGENHRHPGNYCKGLLCSIAWQKRSARVDVKMAGRGLSPRSAEGDRSTRPVHGAATGQEPAPRTAGVGQPQSRAGGLWVHRVFSVVRPVSLVAATASRPTGQEGFVNPGRGGTAVQGLGPSAITYSPNVPTSTKDLGRGGASSPRQGKEDFSAKTYCKGVPNNRYLGVGGGC
jgi:hypothetical protein